MKKKKKNNKKRQQLSLFSFLQKNKNNNTKEQITLAQRLNLSEEIVHFISALTVLFFAIFFLGARFDISGKIGNFIYSILEKIMGDGYYLIPILFLFLSVMFFKNLQAKFTKLKLAASLVFILSGLGLIQLLTFDGGLIGIFIAKIENLIGYSMAIIFTSLFLIISLVIISNSVPKFFYAKKEEENQKKIKKENSTKLTEQEEEKISAIAEKMTEDKINKKTKKSSENSDSEEEKKKKPLLDKIFKNTPDESQKIVDKIKERLNMFGDKVILPPLKLLSKDKGKPSAGNIKINANIIKNTLASFGIPVEMMNVDVGPTITRYSLKPAQGVKLSKIATLNDDLALALAAKSILIQTPIPGQSLVGIEIPNQDKTIVGAGTLLSSAEFIDSKFVLPLGIGKGISGKTTIIGLEKTPHMLIAGATGAGKSVTVHAIINSLLYKHGPDTLKFIMIDPKRVELTLYNNIPHLLTPVVVDPKKAILVLRWAVNEMNRRYDVLEKNKVRDISSYHQNIYQKAKKENTESDEMPESMPYIVIIIDELADIMQQFPKELEAGIVSIAQKARAVGIHLILSTQRPSVNVVTGLIKANVPTRLALQVSSVVDSKTILDMKGAEKLIGKGDMLYMTGDMPKPMRVQSAFISEEEVKAVVKFIKKAYKNELGERLNLSGENNDQKSVFEMSENQNEENKTPTIDFDSEDLEDQDELLIAAKEEVIASGKASTSYLQRKFSIGYARAAKLIDILEEKGVVGPANGSKPREVLYKNEE